MYKEDLALNNLQWLICHKIKEILILIKKKTKVNKLNIQFRFPGFLFNCWIFLWSSKIEINIW